MKGVSTAGETSRAASSGLHASWLTLREPTSVDLAVSVSVSLGREAGRLGKIDNNSSTPRIAPPALAPSERGATPGFRGNWPEWLGVLHAKARRYAVTVPAADLCHGGPDHNDGPRRQVWRLLGIRRWSFLSTAPEYSGELDPWLLRLSGCRHVVTGGGVGIRGAWSSTAVPGERPGSTHVAGVTTCGSVWTCPACAEKIKLERAAEVKQAVDWSRRQGHRVSMLTLTFAHDSSGDVREYMRGVARAYARLTAGRSWQTFAARWTIRHSVRAMEVTDGIHGWHVHLHVLLIHDGDLGEEARASLARRWAGAVVAELGDAAAPRVDGVGCNLQECSPHEEGDYLSKLGLDLGFELSSSGTKSPRSGQNWSIWDLLAWSPLDPSSHARWLDWCRGSKGRKFLSWSGGFKKAAGIGQTTDEDAASDEPKDAARVVDIGHLTPLEWRAVRRAMDGEACVLATYRDRGVAAGRALVVELVERAERDDERAYDDRDENTPTPESEHPPSWDLDILPERGTT